jgi:phosphonate transport system ATP-binding protein
LMQDPDLILADEPTSSLDPKTSVEVMEIMVRLAGARNTPVVINIHNVDLAKRFSNRIIGMARGTVVFDGPPGDLKDHHLADIYGGESWMEAA